MGAHQVSDAECTAERSAHFRPTGLHDQRILSRQSPGVMKKVWVFGLGRFVEWCPGAAPHKPCKMLKIKRIYCLLILDYPPSYPPFFPILQKCAAAPLKSFAKSLFLVETLETVETEQLRH